MTSSDPTGLTHKIAEFVAGIGRADIPDDVLAAPVVGIADCVSVMIAGANEPAPRLVTTLVHPRSGPQTAPIIPTGQIYDAPDAALINATAAHVLDYDDVGIDGHPSVVLGPAILAEGWALDSTGREAVRAYLAGYEIWALFKAMEPGLLHDRGFHPTAVCGGVAVAAASAVLHRLNVEQTRNALAIGASLAAGLVANFGTMTKSLHAGRTAQSGILAARLAAQGFTGSADALEHPAGFLAAHSPSGQPNFCIEPRLGSLWRLRDYGLNVKRYPICYATHRPIDAMLALAAQHNLDLSHIREIRVGAGQTQLHMLRNHAPQTGLEAKFSMEFAMASAVVARAVGLAQLSDDFVRRNDVQDLMSKVTCRAIHDGIPGIPPKPGAPMHADLVEVVLADGTVLAHPPVEYPKGSWQRPLTRAELRTKFFDCAQPILGETTQALFDRLMCLPDLPSLRALKLDQLVPGTT